MMPETAFSGTNWSLAIAVEQQILNKLKANSVPLGEYAKGQIQYGIKTGFNEAFVIDQVSRDRLIAEDSKSAEIIKPFIAGEDIKRYEIDFKEQYLIFTRRGIDIAKYKAVEQYLLQFRNQLEPRPTNEESASWPGRKPGSYKWYEIQDNVAYYADFEKRKIVFPDIAKNCKFAIDESGNYTANTSYIIPIENHQMHLISLLNSSLTEFFYRTISSSIRGGYMRFIYQWVTQIPIFRFNFTTLPKERAYYFDKAKALYQQCLSKNDQLCVLGFVDRHLSKEPEESDVVHDLLAFLAEEMIRLNKAKQAGQKEFLGWLAMTLKILPDKEGKKGIDVLTGKGKISNYPGDYQKGEPALGFEELLDILRKNKSKLGVSLNDTRLVERLRSTYEASLEKVLPLKERLARTDALIDRVVYRLYGLTEEEIGVVEGRG
jgi:hypothetical protein